MYVLDVFGLDVLPRSADDVLEMENAHGLVTVQVYAAFARAEPKAFLFGAEALAELIGIHAHLPFFNSSYPISSCHVLQVLKF